MISTIPKWAGNLFEDLLRPNVKITDISCISPSIKKIRLKGNIANMNLQIGYANVIRVSETEYRNYTVAYHDAKEGVLDILFHIHGNGVGSRYIDTLQTGDELYISNPRGRKEYDPTVEQQFLFGDETSLGLACSFLPELKKRNHQYQFYFELDEENQNVPRLLGLENYIVYPKNGSFRSEEWINALPVCKTDEWRNANFILTGNAKSVRAFRRALKNKKVSGKLFAVGYWLEGKKGL